MSNKGFYALIPGILYVGLLIYLWIKDRPKVIDKPYSYLHITIIFLIIFSSVWWSLVIPEKNKSEGFKIREENDTTASGNKKALNLNRYIYSMVSNDSVYKLRDYYIKTAYNCCATDRFKFGYVNVSALKKCIYQGVRCLDFEIYSVDNMPVVSVSSKNSFKEKESLNSLPFADAMRIIKTHAFSGGNCPNNEDPLIIYLRIMSNNEKIFESMTSILYNTLSDRLLSKAYSYANYGKNLGEMPINDLKEKVIVIVEGSNKLLYNSPLYEYVNMVSSSPFFHEYRLNDVLNTHDTTYFTDFNKKNMSIVLPNLSKASDNPQFETAKLYGCQMIAMSFQTDDDNLKKYNEMFDNAQTAFVLKPENLRYIPVTIPVPPPPNPAHSFAKRDIKADYYNFTI